MSQKGGCVLYPVGPNFEALDWRFSSQKRSGESPQDHEKTDVVIKGLEFMFLAIYIDQNTVCSHTIHNQAMYQQNWSSNSYNSHCYDSVLEGMYEKHRHH